jgi:hypothetical protein
VSNSIASNNGQVGIVVDPNGSVVTGVLSKVTANNNNNGIFVHPATGGNVTIVDSVASNNTTVGVLAISSSSGIAPAAVMVRNSVASYNSDTGLSAQTHAILRVAHSVVTGNNTGVSTADGGTLFSYGDNDINGNTTDNTGALTPLAMN